MAVGQDIKMHAMEAVSDMVLDSPFSMIPSLGLLLHYCIILSINLTQFYIL